MDLSQPCEAAIMVVTKPAKPAGGKEAPQGIGAGILTHQDGDRTGFELPVEPGWGEGPHSDHAVRLQSFRAGEARTSTEAAPSGALADGKEKCRKF